ncbi:MAG: hypothetical protein QF786_14450, partial [Vicinamibacterales bacterium]|nr:hypothetical protein [Vicinamibacterales bacterium]
PQHATECAVAAEQNVGPVVDFLTEPTRCQGERPSAEVASCFDQGDAEPKLVMPDRRCDSRNAAAEYDDTALAHMPNSAK